MLTDKQLNVAGLRSEFFDALQAAPTIYQDLCTTIQSNKEKESYGFLGSVPPARECGTGRKAQGMFTEKYDVTNSKYEISISCSRDELDDDQTSQIRLRTRELGERMAQFWDGEVARLLINGHSSGCNSYDSVPFFSGSHVSGKSGTQDNDITSPAVAPTAPTTAEARTAISSAIATLLGFRDDQNEPMNNDATGLAVIAPPATYLTFLEALSATIVASTSNVLANAARVIAFPRLSTASVFYLLKLDVQVRPLILQQRMPVEFGALEQQSDAGFMREEYVYGARMRGRLGFGYWQRAIKVTLV